MSRDGNMTFKGEPMIHLKRYGCALGLALCLIGSLFPRQAQAVVVTNLLNPPMVVNPFRDDEYVLELDLDQNQVTDLRLFSSGGGGGGSVAAFFNWPTRLVTRTNGVPGSTNINYGGVGGLPFGSVLGSELSVSSGSYTWWTGFTNNYDLTLQFGDHKADVNIASLLEAGDSGGKEGVVGVEFRVNGEVHYGYLHFDFRLVRGYGGYGGLIYGWAYESAPNTPITAAKLRNTPLPVELKITSFTLWPEGSGAATIAWDAMVGDLNRVQASSDLVNWTDVSADLLVTQDFMSYNLPPTPESAQFFRIERGN